MIGRVYFHDGEKPVDAAIDCGEGELGTFVELDSDAVSLEVRLFVVVLLSILVSLDCLMANDLYIQVFSFHFPSTSFHLFEDFLFHARKPMAASYGFSGATLALKCDKGKA